MRLIAWTLLVVMLTWAGVSYETAPSLESGRHQAAKPITEEPATEEPATEEPATEEPATEEPATEEPATQVPGAGSPEASPPQPHAAARDGEYIYPRIQDYGKVVRFADASEQPRPGSKICVDITAGGEPDAINPAIDKLARFLNIYAGAGKQPADVKIAVVLHDNATNACLKDEEYAARFKTQNNPNLVLIRILKQAGVEFCVCGQSATSKKIAPDQIAPEVDLAVSALTANVNRQADGYAYIPMP